MKFKKIWLVVLVVVLLAAGGFWLFQRSGGGVGQSGGKFSRNYYISFDNYYYEIPKKKTADDQIVAGAQFVYSLGTTIKTNSLDDLYNDGAIGIQPLIPLNGDNGAFDAYINTVAKPGAANSVEGGEATLTMAERKDGVKTAELLVQKDGKIVRRQFIVNLPQAVAIVTKDDSEAYKLIGATIGRASDKFSNYEDIKSLAVSSAVMVKNQMFDVLFEQTHPDLKAASSVDEIKRIAERSKDLFGLETKVYGVKVVDNEITASVIFFDSKKPENSKIVNLSFRLSDNHWRLFTLRLPNGLVTGSLE